MKNWRQRECFRKGPQQVQRPQGTKEAGVFRAQERGQESWTGVSKMNGRQWGLEK